MFHSVGKDVACEERNPTTFFQEMDLKILRLDKLRSVLLHVLLRTQRVVPFMGAGQRLKAP